jgi:predicted dehydrogenase
MRAFCGGFDEVKAFASAGFSAEVEDDLVAILRNRAGQLASLCSSHTQWQPAFSLDLGLSGGAVSVRGLLSQSGRYGPERLIWRTRDDALEHVEVFETDNSWALEIDEFFAAARGVAPVRVGSTTEALELMTLVEAIYASAEWPVGVHRAVPDR